MATATVRRLLYGALVLLYLLHNDLWYWEDATLVAGLPIGLFYHLMFCLAACVLMALLVNFAWPAHLEQAAGGEGDK